MCRSSFNLLKAHRPRLIRDIVLDGESVVGTEVPVFFVCATRKIHGVGCEKMRQRFGERRMEHTNQIAVAPRDLRLHLPPR